MRACASPSVGQGRPPVFSVITVCRNAEATIERTIQSVIAQDYPHLEYIVVDGMSADATWRLVQIYESQVTLAIHEPDTGVYNAMNKGIQRSHGDILCFLNADDYFASPSVLSEVANAFSGDAQLDIAYGDYVWDDGTRQIHYLQPDRVTRKYLLLGHVIHHQSMFFHRRTFACVGPFDESYKLAADREWNVRGFLGARLSYRHLPVTVCVFNALGLSGVYHERLRAEREAIIRRHFRPDERFYLWARLGWLKARVRWQTKNFSPPRRVRQWLGREET